MLVLPSVLSTAVNCLPTAVCSPHVRHATPHSFVLFLLQSTLAEPCGYNRKTSDKTRTYTVLQCQQSSRHTSLQQQQIQRLPQRQTNKTDVEAPPTLPSAEQHEPTTNQSVQQLPQNCSEDEELKLTLIECKPVDTLPSSSYQMYACRPRGSSSSSQTTLTTSLGKLSVNEGNSCCRAATGDSKTNGDCGGQSKVDLVITTCGVARRKQEDVERRSRKGIATITSKLKSAPRAATIGVLAKKLRALPLAGNSKGVVTPQHNAAQECADEDVHEASINRLSSHVSIDSAKSTISNSSLKDLDDTEFTGSELAHYMGELNRERLVH